MAMRQRDKGATGKETGEIFRVAGPVVTATGLRPRMYDVQFVGEEQLLGEVIQIVGEKTIIQVYEDTSGVKPGEAVMDTGAPLVVELGPGLLGSIYDGVQRPLPVLQKAMGDFILRGLKSPGLTREKTWRFAPKVKQGQLVGPGDVVGTVQEAKNVEHRIMVPPKGSAGEGAADADNPSGHRPTGPRLPLPDREGRDGRHPRRLRDGKNGDRTTAFEVVRRPSRHLHRLRRTRE